MSDMILIGNLTADPELRNVSGSQVVNFRIAENKRKRQDDGTYKDVSTTFYSVEVWGTLAEVLAARLKKGYRVKAIGEFSARDFQRGDGSPAVSLELKAWGVKVMSRPKNDNTAPTQQGSAHQPNNDPASWNPPANDPWAASNPNPPASDPWAATNPNPPTNDPWTARANPNGGWAPTR